MFKKAVIYLYGESDDVAEIVQGVHLLAQRFDVRVEFDDPKPHVPVSGIIDAEEIQKIAPLPNLDAETRMVLDHIKEARKTIDEDIQKIIEHYKQVAKP
jgi:hypothetical protein